MKSLVWFQFSFDGNEIQAPHGTFNLTYLTEIDVWMRELEVILSVNLTIVHPMPSRTLHSLPIN